MSNARMRVLLKPHLMVIRVSTMGNSEARRKFMWLGNFDGFGIAAAVGKGEDLPGAVGTNGLK